VEEISKILSNGFETYTKNLNLSIPFVINIILTGMLFVIMLIFGLLYVFGSSLDSLNRVERPEELVLIFLPLITKHITEIVLMIAVFVILVMFIQAFFTAGAIGMAKLATETGKSDLYEMITAGKKNLINLFLAELLVGLISLAGIVFLIPGAMRVNFSQLMSSENAAGGALLIGGIFLWIVYLIIISIVLAVFRFALVIDNLGPIESITTGFGFFKKHKMDVFLIFIVVITLAIIFMILDQVLGYIPIIKLIWPLISIFISLIIIPPVTTLWWVRLYMAGTDKKLYFNDLLAHPFELQEDK